VHLGNGLRALCAFDGYARNVTVYLWRRVPLVNDKGTALIWACDYELVSQYRWYLKPADVVHRAAYARRVYRTPDGRSHTQLMHQLITGQMNMDHKNFDGLDNRRSNLRPADDSQSSAHQRKQSNNTSGFIGVSWEKRRNRWIARIRKNGKVAWQANFADLEEAALARDAKALEIYGEYAVLNFP